jgi:hypothetical protein
MDFVQEDYRQAGDHVVSDPYWLYRPWFYAAAVYNLTWGLVNILWPSLIFDFLGVRTPNYPPSGRSLACSSWFMCPPTGRQPAFQTAIPSSSSSECSASY